LCPKAAEDSDSKIEIKENEQTGAQKSDNDGTGG